MILTAKQQSDYAEQGFLRALPALSTAKASETRAAIEALETDYSDGANGRDLGQYFRVNGQLVLPLLADIARTPAILDAVADILGPNLLVWSVELFIKEPGTKSIVSWHQDLTYWGMGETDEELTAWVALSDVSQSAGCMRFIPASHKNAIVAHEDTSDPDNLLSRGQQIASIDESAAVYGALKPGEMSFHHGRTFHASGPNRSDDRRIGVAIRYVTPEVRQPQLGRDYAMLVRGKDANQGWINVAPPLQNFEPMALELYEEVLAHQSVTLTAGAENDIALYDTAGVAP